MPYGQSQLPGNIHRSSFLSSGRSTRQPVNQSSESEREESEYERTGDEDERWTSRGRSHVLEDGNDEPEQEAEGVDVNEESDEDEVSLSPFPLLQTFKLLIIYRKFILMITIFISLNFSLYLQINLIG